MKTLATLLLALLACVNGQAADSVTVTANTNGTLRFPIAETFFSVNQVGTNRMSILVVTNSITVGSTNLAAAIAAKAPSASPTITGTLTVTNITFSGTTRTNWPSGSSTLFTLLCSDDGTAHDLAIVLNQGRYVLNVSQANSSSTPTAVVLEFPGDSTTHALTVVTNQGQYVLNLAQ